MQKSSGKRIARNTLYLYVRMGVMMLVRLYTVRVVLEVLGIDDYGLWNVIMAFVTGFTFVSPTLVSSTQRFLNYEMGAGGNRLTRIFSTSCAFFALLAVALAVALETFGLWFLNTRMQIPPGMVAQANWVYQFCLLTLVADMARMPYEAVIVAEERMSFYAVVSLFEAVLLLGIVFILPLWPAGWLLAAYGLLTLGAHACISAMYALYARRHALWARVRMIVDKALAREMAAFSGWNIFGSLASMLAVQGINVLMNVYFGVGTNSAYGVALQVHAAVFIFVVNISKASSPGIVKDYAAGALDSMRRLVMNIGKFSYLLILMLVVPAAFNIGTLLHLWLGANVPPEAPLFCVLVMAQVLVVSFTPAIDSAVFATGRIRNYQLALSALIAVNFGGTLALYAC
ncbi:MAG: lipopolysaccharide biosynthesis protein, partial [Muribaculum sp.]|nr:lipopolysaccharide biosynthesis protein [Muribaculum sp.]